jgi:hypothetical protein
MHSKGSLDAVIILEWNSTMITWEPPFSLDLTDIDPDIAYCVEVHNITCGERGFVLGECSLIDLTLSYDYSHLDNAFVYEIAITPKSNVKGADNGTRSIITGSQTYTCTIIDYNKT